MVSFMFASFPRINKKTGSKSDQKQNMYEPFFENAYHEHSNQAEQKNGYFRNE